MKLNRLHWLALFVLGLMVAACNPTPRITGATLGTVVQASKIEDPKTTFAPSDHMIQLIVNVENVVGSTNIGAKWYSVDGGERVLFEGESALDPLNTSAEFALTAANDWKPGSYKVVIFLNGKEDRQLNFQVK